VQRPHNDNRHLFNKQILDNLKILKAVNSVSNKVTILLQNHSIIRVHISGNSKVAALKMVKIKIFILKIIKYSLLNTTYFLTFRLLTNVYEYRHTYINYQLNNMLEI
jgi:hypothetical protein